MRLLWLLLPLSVAESTTKASDVTTVCPGGVPPLFNLNDGKNTFCNGLDIRSNMGNKYCCPKVKSIDTDVFVSSGKDKHCKKIEECAEDEFCGYVVDEKGNEGPRPLCHKRPVCGGKVVIKDMAADFGKVVATCEKDDECGKIKAGSFCSNGKLCCTFESTSCPVIPDVPKEKLKTHAVVFSDTSPCNHCKDPKQTSCPVTENIKQYRKHAKGLNLEKFICTNAADGGFRMCGYHIDEPKCPLKNGKLSRNGVDYTAFDTPLRNNDTGSVIECNSDEDCNVEGGVNAVCEKNSVAVGAKNICCPIEACASDNFFTGFVDSHKCTSDKDCSDKVGNGTCVRGKTNQYCCPKAVPSKEKTVLNIEGPFKTLKPCKSIEDCKNDGLFCDPETNTCIYHKETSVRKDFAVEGTCFAENMTCPMLQSNMTPVCMYDSQTKSYGCFRHVQDECTKNSDCAHLFNGICYCDQIPDGKLISYEGGACLYRKCGSGKIQQSKPYIDPNIWGLQFCAVSDHCSDDAFCMVLPELLKYVKINNRVCNAKPVIPCRGKAANIKYYNGVPVTCQYNRECASFGQNYFCDSTAKVKQTTPWATFPQGIIGICCSVPAQCGGKLEYLPVSDDVGIKTCTSNAHCKDGTCSTYFEKEKENTWKQNEGVCCSMTCDKKHPEVNGLGISEKIACGDPEGKCTSSMIKAAYCEDAPGAAVPYQRCCRYARIRAECPGGSQPLRTKDFELRSCKSYMDCRTSAPGGANCVKPLNDVGLETICCPAEKCNDQYTDGEHLPDYYYDDGTETACGKKGSNGVILFIEHKAKCCPKVKNVQEIQNGAYALVSEYFDIKKPCQTLNDCLGEGRFCDPVDGYCKYFGTDNIPRSKAKLSGSFEKECSIKNVSCGTINNARTVCMAEGGDSPKCYLHPLETCTENKECNEKEYCAPPFETKPDLYDISYRTCLSRPKDSVLSENGQGLKVCKNDSDCGDETVFCHLKDYEGLSVSPGHGFCQYKERIKCRGKFSLKYDNEMPFMCQFNNECETNEFCDFDIQRPSFLPKDRGICCSKPEKCGGEVVLKDTGIKVCKEDKECDLAMGEVCSKSFDRGEETNWMEEDGVCCKFTCPPSEMKEASNKTVVAGAKCGEAEENEKNQCETDHAFFRSCLDAPEADYKRCCSYERRKDLCPLHIGTIQRDDNGLAKLCEEGSCSDREVCTDGFCCKPSTCLDTYTELYLEKECNNEKDCDQPEGFTAVCHLNRCCPKTYGNLIEVTFLSNIKCSTVADCPYRRMYCNVTHGRCAYIESGKEPQIVGKCESMESVTCNKNGKAGICFYETVDRNGLPSCSIEGKIIVEEKPAEVPEEESNTGLIVGLVIGALVLVIIAGVVGVVVYKYISKRNSKKKKKLSRFQMPTKRASTPPKASAKEVRTNKSSKPPPTPSGRSTVTPNTRETGPAVSGGAVTPNHSHRSSVQIPHKNSNVTPSSTADQVKSKATSKATSTISAAGGSRDTTPAAGGSRETTPA